MRDHATSSNDREKSTNALETTRKSVNTLQNWLQTKQKHAEECSQESIRAHPEARSSTDIDMTQTFETTTTADGHLDKARKTSEAGCNMSKGDDDTHTEHLQIDTQEDRTLECIFSKKTIAQHKENVTCAACHARRNRGSRMRVCERCGKNALRTMQTTLNIMRSEGKSNTQH